ncbi:hypothetical protein JCM19236_3097 [Vibrio sp. JCM 19236]|nr:hypothetical protein JCM19236_3097 [Vibrio sp. JCM 19236]
MKLWLVTLLALTLSACHLNTKEDENVTEFVCAMEVSSQMAW